MLLCGEHALLRENIRALEAKNVRLRSALEHAQAQVAELRNHLGGAEWVLREYCTYISEAESESLAIRKFLSSAASDGSKLLEEHQRLRDAVDKLRRWIEGRNEMIIWRGAAVYEYFHGTRKQKAAAKKFLLEDIEGDDDLRSLGLTTSVDDVLDALAEWRGEK